MAKPSLIGQVIEISQDYLGPAAGRFIDRQVKTHLKKKPDKLTKPDIIKLVDWIKLSFAMLTEDAQMVNEYTDRLLSVASGNSKKAIVNNERQSRYKTTTVRPDSRS